MGTVAVFKSHPSIHRAPYQVARINGGTDSLFAVDVIASDLIVEWAMTFVVQLYVPHHVCIEKFTDSSCIQ